MKEGVIEELSKTVKETVAKSYSDAVKSESQINSTSVKRCNPRESDNQINSKSAAIQDNLEVRLILKASSTAIPEKTLKTFTKLKKS